MTETFNLGFKRLCPKKGDTRQLSGAQMVSSPRVVCVEIVMVWGKHNFNLRRACGSSIWKEKRDWVGRDKEGWGADSFHILLRSIQSVLIYNTFHLILATLRQGREQRT